MDNGVKKSVIIFSTAITHGHGPRVDRRVPTALEIDVKKIRTHVLSDVLGFNYQAIARLPWLAGRGAHE